MIGWIADNLLVTAIVALTLLLGVVLSIAEDILGEPLATILITDTLIATVAILAAAVTAAVYAKPAYDDAVNLRRPAQLKITEFTLRAGGSEIEPETGVSPRVFLITCDCPTTLTLDFTVRNVGRHTTRAGFNLRVPEQCGLSPSGDPASGHHLTPGARVRELVPDVLARCVVSSADTVIPRNINKSYSAELTIPAGVCPWESGWPARLLFFNPSSDVDSEPSPTEETWWMRPAQPSAEPETDSLDHAPSAI
jgi:hypothetical protein